MDAIGNLKCEMRPKKTQNDRNMSVNIYKDNATVLRKTEKVLISTLFFCFARLVRTNGFAFIVLCPGFF